MGGFVKSVVKTVGDIATFGAVSRHDQAKAQRKQAEAQAKAAEMQAKAQEEQARAQREAMQAQTDMAQQQAQVAKEAAANIPEDRQQAMSAALREDEKNKLRRRRGLTGTILTSSLGVTGQQAGSGNKLGVM